MASVHSKRLRAADEIGTGRLIGGGLDLVMNENRAYVLLRQARATVPGLEARGYSIWTGFLHRFAAAFR